MEIETEELPMPSSVDSSTASTTSPAVPGPGTGLPPLPPGKVPATGSAGTSDVWNHFEKYIDLVDSDELNEDGTKKKIEKKRAKCIHCFGTYAADPGVNGTSSMKAHMGRCKKFPGRRPDKRQKSLCFEEGGMVARGATQAGCLSACVEMVIIDELAFSFVEGKGFRKFCSIACPYFEVPSRRTLVRHFLFMYSELKQKLKKDLASHRVCLTTVTWTS